MKVPKGKTVYSGSGKKPFKPGDELPEHLEKALDTGGAAKKPAATAGGKSGGSGKSSDK